MAPGKNAVMKNPAQLGTGRGSGLACADVGRHVHTMAEIPI
jgi:hypothetical protein